MAIMSEMQSEISDSGQIEVLEDEIFNKKWTTDTQRQLNKRHELAVHNTVFSLEDMSDDDEVWLMQCPINISEDQLLNQYLSLNNTSPSTILKLKNEIHKFETKISTQLQKSTFCCLFPNHEINSLSPVVLHVAGHIVLKEIFSNLKDEERECLVQDSDSPTVPSNLKQRHPLFGADFEESLQPRLVFPKGHISHLQKYVEEILNSGKAETKQKRKAKLEGEVDASRNKYTEEIFSRKQKLSEIQTHLVDYPETVNAESEKFNEKLDGKANKQKRIKVHDYASGNKREKSDEKCVALEISEHYEHESNRVKKHRHKDKKRRKLYSLNSF